MLMVYSSSSSSSTLPIIYNEGEDEEEEEGEFAFASEARHRSDIALHCVLARGIILLLLLPAALL